MCAGLKSCKLLWVMSVPLGVLYRSGQQSLLSRATPTLLGIHVLCKRMKMLHLYSTF